MENVYRTFTDENGMVIEVLDKEINNTTPKRATERYSDAHQVSVIPSSDELKSKTDVEIRKAKRSLDVERIIELGKKGYSVRQIEALTGLNRNKVQRALQKHNSESESE